MAETLLGRRDDQNLKCLDEAEVRERELAEAASSTKSKHICNQWSNAQILKLTEDLLCKLGEHRSRQDTGGVDQEEMVRLGQLFMERAFSITTSRAPFLVDTDGNCLPNCLAFIANPNQTQEETAEGGTGLRKMVMGEVLDYIRKASVEALKPIQAAAAASTANLGAWLSRDELLTLLGHYREDGVWAGDLEDLMPQLYASFTNTPLFVIVYDSDQKKIMGYFLSPSYVFNQPTLTAAPRPLICFQNHFEPLVVPEGFREAWEAIYNSYQTQELGMAAIQLQLTEEDLLGGGGERRAGSTVTTAAADRKAGGDVESDQMQQEQNDGGIYAGDHIAVILSISQL